MAEHIGEARLHQCGAPLARNRRAQPIQTLKEPAGRVVDAREPEAADMIDQPWAQCGEVRGIKQRHARTLSRAACTRQHVPAWPTLLIWLACATIRRQRAGERPRSTVARIS